MWTTPCTRLCRNCTAALQPRLHPLLLLLLLHLPPCRCVRYCCHHPCLAAQADAPAAAAAEAAPFPAAAPCWGRLLRVSVQSCRSICCCICRCICRWHAGRGDSHPAAQVGAPPAAAEAAPCPLRLQPRSQPQRGSPALSSLCLPLARLTLHRLPQPRACTRDPRARPGRGRSLGRRTSRRAPAPGSPPRCGPPPRPQR